MASSWRKRQKSGHQPQYRGGRGGEVPGYSGGENSQKIAMSSDINEIVYDSLLFLDSLIDDRAVADRVRGEYAILFRRIKRFVDHYQEKPLILFVLLDYVRMVIEYDWKLPLGSDLKITTIRASRRRPIGSGLVIHDTFPWRTFPCYISLKIIVSEHRIVETLGQKIKFQIGSQELVKYTIRNPPADRRHIRR